MTTIIKRRGHEEHFDERKVYASAYFACRNAHLPIEEAERIATAVTDRIKQWIGGQAAVNSDDVFKKITEELRTHDEDSAFLYETHRDLS